MTLFEILEAELDELRKRYAVLHSRAQLNQSSAEEDKEMVLVWNELKAREIAEKTKDVIERAKLK